MVRTIARKTYQNGAWGAQSASLEYDDGLRDGFRVSRPHWVVHAWDIWAHDALEQAKAHFRSIGNNAFA